jgi:hypothetical protein
MFKQMFGSKLTDSNAASSMLANHWMNPFRSMNTSSSRETPDEQTANEKTEPDSEAKSSRIDVDDQTRFRPEDLKPSRMQTRSLSTKTIRQHRGLVRQSSETNSAFPLKPFQRVNSDTVEIPGLNVKVVRYHIEDDLGSIEPQMYIKYNSASVDAATNMSKGKLFFSLQYNQDIQSLSVTVVRAEILSQPTSQARLDTYVKIQLYPDKKRKYQTKVVRRTTKPVFDETFYFNVPYAELSAKTLCLTLFDFGRFSKLSFLGSVRMTDLHSIKDLISKDTEFVKPLLPFTDVWPLLV